MTTLFDPCFRKLDIHEKIDLALETAIEEILGVDKINDQQKQIKDVIDINSMQAVAFEVGRSFFNHLLRELGNELGFFDQEYRLSATRKRLKKGLEKIVSLAIGEFSYSVDLITEETGWILHFSTAKDIPAIPVETQPSWLHGWLQEYLSWAGGGKYYPIKISFNDDLQSVHPFSLSISAVPLD
jgi:hypothetical protein